MKNNKSYINSYDKLVSYLLNLFMILPKVRNYKKRSFTCFSGKLFAFALVLKILPDHLAPLA